jgi:hypothetical protein
MVVTTLKLIATIITLVPRSHARKDSVNLKMLFAMITIIVLMTIVFVNLVVYPGLKTVMTITLVPMTAVIPIVDANMKK